MEHFYIWYWWIAVLFVAQALVMWQFGRKGLARVVKEPLSPAYVLGILLWTIGIAWGYLGKTSSGQRLISVSPHPEALFFAGCWSFLVFRTARKLERSRGFPQGPYGSVPLSSAQLNAELLEQARAQLGQADLALLNRILQCVAFERYSEALNGISQMQQEARGPEVDALLLWTKSNIYHRTNRFSEEITILNQLCSATNRPIFQLNLANAYSQLSRYSEAEPHYLKAVELTGGLYPLASYNLGIMYCRVGNKDQALAQLRTLEASSEAVPENLVDRLKLRISQLA